MLFTLIVFIKPQRQCFYHSQRFRQELRRLRVNSIQYYLRGKGRGIILTEKGKAFIPFADQIIRTFHQGKKQLKTGSELEEITIGANIITSQYFIPFALPLWKKENPNLRFKFISATNDALMEKLLQKQVDIAFMKDVTHSGLQNYKTLDNSIRLVVYPGHPFQLQTELTVQELAMEPLVFFECGAFDWNHVHKIFEVSNVEPRIEFQVDHLEVAKSLILSRSCIGFLPYLCIKKELEQGTLIEVDVSHLIKIKQAHLSNAFKSRVGITLTMERHSFINSEI